MFPQNACDILKNLGTTTEALDPSNLLTEANMDLPVTVPTPFKIQGYGAVNIDIDQIAQVIDQHQAVILSLNLSWEEWQAVVGVPQVIAGSTIDGGHELSGIDYTLYNGKKAIICKNHWGDNDGY